MTISANRPPAKALDAYENERVYAMQKLGRSDLLTWFHAAGAAGAAGVTNVNGGTATTVPSSGALRMQAGATSGGLTRLYPFSPDGTNFMALIRNGQPWFISARFALITTPTTGAIMSVGANNIGNHLRMGVDFNNQGSNFMLEGMTGTLMNSGIPFDTAVHTFRAWRVGGTTYFEIDGSLVVTGNVDVNADAGPLAWAGNGTNANQGMDLIWWDVAAPSK